MKVLAYCAAPFERSVRRASGVQPILSPPILAEDFDIDWLADHDLIMFKLHGFEGKAEWYNDSGEVALTAEQVRQADLRGAVVFVSNCWLPESPMLDALLDAGARAVIGGSGENYAGKEGLHGADLLALYLRQMMEKLDVGDMLRLAKLRLRFKWPTKATVDTLGFRVYSGDSRRA